MTNRIPDIRLEPADHYIGMTRHETELQAHTTQEKRSKLAKTFGVTVAAAALQTISHSSGLLLLNALNPVFKPHLMLEAIVVGHLEISSLILAIANINQIPERNPNLEELFNTVFGACMLITAMAGITLGEFTLNSRIRHAFLEAENLNETPFDCYDSTTYDACHNKGSTEDFYARLSGFGFGTGIAIPLLLTIGFSIIALAMTCKEQARIVAQGITSHVRSSVTYLKSRPRHIPDNDEDNLTSRYRRPAMQP